MLRGTRTYEWNKIKLNEIKHTDENAIEKNHMSLIAIIQVQEAKAYIIKPSVRMIVCKKLKSQTQTKTQIIVQTEIQK